MVRTLHLNSETRPELSRILAIAAAIAVHAFAFLLLLIPMAVPPPQTIAERKPEITFIEPEKKIVEVPIRAEKPKPATRQQVVDKTPRTVIPTVEPPVIVEGGAIATNPQATTDPGPVIDPGPAIATPVSMDSLAYVRATPPPYPRPEARVGIQGTVLLRVLVDVDGRPLEVVVQESSGNKSLDRSAREHVLKHWLFQPAMRDGKAVQAYGKVPVVFSMQ